MSISVSRFDQNPKIFSLLSQKSKETVTYSYLRRIFSSVSLFCINSCCYKMSKYLNHLYNCDNHGSSNFKHCYNISVAFFWVSFWSETCQMFSGGCSNVAAKIRPHLYVNSQDRLILIFCVCTYCRCEIESTLERLRKLERELYSKEKELEERERRLRLWEERLMERSNMSPSPTALLMERSNISPVSRSGGSLFRQLKSK